MPIANATAKKTTDVRIERAIQAYKDLHASVAELEKKVAEEQKRFAALLDKSKVKKILKDIISQPQ